MSSLSTGLQSLETDDPTETSLQNPVSSADTSSSQPDVNADQNTQKQLSSPRPILIYTRDQLLFLSNSPLVKAPPDMPDLKSWAEIENQVKKDEPSTPGNARERRFRRDAEDGEAHPRPTFRSTLTQPSQMGNFKHQSLRPNDRDRERDRERDGEKDRERDIRDKEGQERLRHLSDKYDRDRLAQPPPIARSKDTATNISANSTRGSQVLNVNAAARRTETREAGKKKVGEACEDWRRGAEHRPAREDRSDNGSKRDSSAPRRDREKDHDETREKGRRGDRDDHRREKEEPRRDRDIDTEDDPRRWKDDGRREERLANRRAERERARDKPGQDHALEATTDRRWTPADDRDGRYKRSSARERKSGHLGDEGKEKEDRKDREKEKEPAWMDTYIPTDSSPGILGGHIPGGELDGIQAWKKGLKDKEVKDHENSSLNEQGQTSLGQPSSSALPEPTEKAMDEIQLFKLMMKREEEKKKSEDTSVPVLLDDSECPQPTQQRHRKMLEEADSSGNIILSLSGFTNSEQPQNLVSTSIVDPSPVQAGNPPENISLASKVQSDPKFDHLPDRNLPLAKPFSIAVSAESQTSAKHTSDFSAAQSFHPPAGSRLLAFARVQQKAVPNANQATTLQTLNGQGVQAESQGFPKNDSSRPVASFSPFEEQSRQAYDDSGIATNLVNLSLRGPVDQMFNSSHNQPEPVYNGFAAAKGSRFAKFFDGKTRDAPAQPNKSQGPVGYISPSPNHHQRQEPNNLSNLASNPGDQRTMDDIFAMLNSSSQRGNIAHPVTGQPLSNNGFGAQGPNLHVLQQQHLQQQQQHNNGRLESLYESRADDRSFVPDGMVPGLRPIPPLPARSRDNPGYFPEQPEDGLHYNLQRMTQQQQTRNLESLYSGSVTPTYGQQGRHGGMPLQSLQQAQYRGGPSPNPQQTTMSNSQQQQRLPPGLANLGGRPPLESAPYQGLSAPSSVNPHNNLHGNGPLPQMQQPSFNNFNIGNNLAFNNSQVRGPMPGSHVQNSVAQHTLGNIGHPNMDPRLSNHHHLMGLGGSGVGGPRMNGGFSQPASSSHLMRPQQQQHPHPHQHILPHLIPPHLQPQGHPGPSNQPNDLMALLMGGPHRE